MIICDIHEPISISDKLGELGVRVHLETGDYMFFSWQGDSIGIERKVQDDLIGSLSSGRLADQLLRLSEEFTYSFLMVVGPFHINSRGNIERRYWSMENGKRQLEIIDTGHRYTDVTLALVSAWMCLGVVPLYVADERWTAAVILEMYHWFQKEEHGQWITKPKRALARLEESAGGMALRGIPGVGCELTDSLLKDFGTLRNIANASEEELRQASKVGKRMAARIHSAFVRGPPPAAGD